MVMTVSLKANMVKTNKVFFYIQRLTKRDLYTSPSEQTGLLRINGSLSDDFRKKVGVLLQTQKEGGCLDQEKQAKEVCVSLF